MFFFQLVHNHNQGKKAIFFLQFIRRLLEHISLLDLAYRMNSTNESKRTTEESGKVRGGEGGDSGTFSMMHMSPQFCKHTCAQSKILLTQRFR